MNRLLFEPEEVIPTEQQQQGGEEVMAVVRIAKDDARARHVRKVRVEVEERAMEGGRERMADLRLVFVCLLPVPIYVIHSRPSIPSFLPLLHVSITRRSFVLSPAIACAWAF